MGKKKQFPNNRNAKKNDSMLGREQSNKKILPKESQQNRTKILWLSDLHATKDQIDRLEDIFGEVEIKYFKKHISNVQEVLEYGHDCKAIASVSLPKSIEGALFQSAKDGIPIIRPIIHYHFVLRLVRCGGNKLLPVREPKGKCIGWERVSGSTNTWRCQM